MALKKNFFKRLQGGVHHSPLKSHEGGPPHSKEDFIGLLNHKRATEAPVTDERVGNIGTKQDNTGINSPKFNSLKTPKAQDDIKNFLDNQKRNQVNIDFRAGRLAEMKKLYPKASEAELTSYLFSDKPGLMPDASSKNFGFTNAKKGTNESLFDLNLTNPNNPSDATAKLAFGSDAYSGEIVDPRDSGNFLFGLNNEEKQNAVQQSIENLNLDTRDNLQNYQYQSLNKFLDWYNHPTTRERIPQQAQHSGNIRQSQFLNSKAGADFMKDKKNVLAKPGQENVAGSLYSEADLDNILSSLKDKTFKYGKGNNAGYIESDGLETFGDDGIQKINAFNQNDYPLWTTDINGEPIRTDAPNLEQDLFTGRSSSSEAVQSVNDDIYINPDMVNASFRPLETTSKFNQFYPRQDFDSFLTMPEMISIMNKGGITNPNRYQFEADTSSKQNFSKSIGGHELTHSTGLDMAMDPYLRSKLELKPENMNRTNNYNTAPGELYANFHELRLHLGMKPGEQWDSEKLKQRLEERGRFDQSKFLDNFTEESLIEALNTVAGADKKDNGKLKFDNLKLKGQSNNYEMNA